MQDNTNCVFCPSRQYFKIIIQEKHCYQHCIVMVDYAVIIIIMLFRKRGRMILQPTHSPLFCKVFHLYLFLPMIWTWTIANLLTLYVQYSVLDHPGRLQCFLQRPQSEHLSPFENIRNLNLTDPRGTWNKKPHKQ